MSSKTLQRLADKDDRIHSYEFDPSNDFGAHWLHLVYPWETDFGGGSIHEKTVRECLESLKTIRLP